MKNQIELKITIKELTEEEYQDIYSGKIPQAFSRWQSFELVSIFLDDAANQFVFIYEEEK